MPKVRRSSNGNCLSTFGHLSGSSRSTLRRARRRRSFVNVHDVPLSVSLLIFFALTSFFYARSSFWRAFGPDLVVDPGDMGWEWCLLLVGRGLTFGELHFTVL